MTRQTRVIAVVMVTTVAIAMRFTVGTQAYSSYAKWGSSTAPFYANPFNADVSDSAAEAALVAAANVWSSQSNAAFRFEYAGRVTDTSTAYDSRNVAIFRNVSNGSTIATTYSWWSGSTLIDSDVVFWDGGFTFFTGSSGCGGANAVYIEDIAAHELGHALGLNHSTATDATMYGSYSTCSQSQRTLASDDIAGVEALYPPTASQNTAPVVSIAAPSNGTSFPQGATISFSGSASDAQDGNLSSRLTWRSSQDGQIGTGGSFSRTLSAGTHVITASVTDGGGLGASSQVTITVTVNPTNTSPVVVIAAPTNGASFVQGTAISFSGSATDTQDGNLAARLTWRSSLDGQIGTGASFSRTLSAGTHVITATVTDSGGLTGSSQVTIAVNASTPSTRSPVLTAKGYKTKGLQKTDLSWNGLTSALVDIYRDGVRVVTTLNDGAYTDAIDARGKASYTYRACNEAASTCTNQVTVSY